MIVRPARPDDLGAILGLARALALQENDTPAENILPTFKVMLPRIDRLLASLPWTDTSAMRRCLLVCT